MKRPPATARAAQRRLDQQRDEELLGRKVLTFDEIHAIHVGLWESPPRLPTPQEARILCRMAKDTARPTPDATITSTVERAVIDAARCIRHWHDTHDGGMIVSGEHVRKLWDALDRYDRALAPRPDAKEGEP